MLSWPQSGMVGGEGGWGVEHSGPLLFSGLIIVDKHCPRLEWAYFSFFSLPLPKTKAPILGDPGAVSQVDKMSVVKVYCKIETSH